MLVLLLCIVSNVLLGVIFKIYGRYQVDNHGAIIVGYFTCLLIAAIILGDSPIPLNIIDISWAPYALFLGLLFIFGFNVMALTFQKFGIAFTTIIQKMSLLISVGFVLIVYHEPLGVKKFLGLIFAFTAIVLVNYTRELFKNPRLFFGQNKLLIFPFTIFVISGIIEVLLYYLQVESIVQDGDIQFVSSSFGIAGVFGLLYFLLPGMRKKHRITKAEIIGGLVLGLPNFFTIYLLVVLLDQGWEGSVLFPMNNIGILLLSALAGIAFFSERLNLIRAIGFIFSILSILLIAWS